MDVDLILANILTDYLDVPGDRIVLYNQNWEPPNDSDVFIIISLGTCNTLGNNNYFDDDTNEEVSQVIQSQEVFIEVTSRGTAAKQYTPQIPSAIASYISEQYQAENTIRIFRTPQVLDLSDIEGASSLHRYRHGVIIQYIETFRRSIDYYDKFSTEEVVE